MFCRNCGNDVHEKAIACPQCGVNPKAEKKFCPSCGTRTNPNQVVCTACGVSLASSSPLSFDTSKLQNIDTGQLLSNKPAIFAAVGVFSFFLNWITVTETIWQRSVSKSYSGNGVSELLNTPGISTILVTALLYLFPLAMVAIVAAAFVPSIARYQKILALTVLVVIIYTGIGIFTSKFDLGDLSAISDDDKKAGPVFSAAFGYYVALIAAVGTAFFSGIINKK